jgi:hypothetical protein
VRRHGCAIEKLAGLTDARPVTLPASSLPPAVSRRAFLWASLLGTLVWGFIFFVPAGPWQATDFLGILVPYQHYLRDSVLAGEFPAWNPYASLGRPFAADPQALVWWPGTLVYLVAGAYLGSFLLVAAHGAWALHATAATARRFGAAPWAALGAGWAFAFNPKLLGHLHVGHVQYVVAWLTLPAIVAAALALRDGVNAGRIARLAGPVAWQFLAGAPQAFWCTALTVALLLGALRLVERGWRPLRREALGVAAAYAWALALGAALLLPLLELVGQSNRGAGSSTVSAIGPLTWNDVPGFFSIWIRPGALWDYEPGWLSSS